MPTIKKFEDLEVWKKSRILVNEIYLITKRKSMEKDYVLQKQMIRSAISIPSNIAEGFERSGRKEFLQFLAIAKGSMVELKAQLYIALDQNYILQNEFDIIYKILSEIGSMLNGLMAYLNKSPIKGAKYKQPETTN